MSEVNNLIVAAAGADRLLREIRDLQFREPEGSPLDDIDADCNKLRLEIIHRTLRGELIDIDDVIRINQEFVAE